MKTVEFHRDGATKQIRYLNDKGVTATARVGDAYPKELLEIFPLQDKTLSEGMFGLLEYCAKRLKDELDKTHSGATGPAPEIIEITLDCAEIASRTSWRPGTVKSAISKGFAKPRKDDRKGIEKMGWDGSSQFVVALARDKVEAFKFKSAVDPWIEEAQKSIAELLGTAKEVQELLEKNLKLRSGAGASEIAAALVDSRSEEATRALRMTQSALPSVPLRKVVADVTCLALPVTKDVRDAVAAARAATGTRIELRLRTETFAEAAMAGRDGQPCGFEPTAPYPGGSTRIQLPAEGAAPFFPREGKVMKEALVRSLTGENGRWKPIGERFSGKENEGDRCVALEADLALKKDDFGRDHYVLIIDADFKHLAPEEIDRHFRDLAGTLKEALPSLVLVRLTGGKREHESEAKAAGRVLSICKSGTVAPSTRQP